jgi:hypothetical protein
MQLVGRERGTLAPEQLSDRHETPGTLAIRIVHVNAVRA